jgi:chitin disaccharide deacetylase
VNDFLTSRLLGYPPDARLLIVNADDFGMCHAVNAAILMAMEQGVVSSTSLMVPCPWAPHAMQILRDHPALPFGVHLTLVSEFTPYRWGPVTSRDRVPSLVDESGHFVRYDQIPELLARARVDEVEVEFRAQIETVFAAGLSPTHLDWHCVADGGREDIFELTLRLAREFGLAIRVHDPAHTEHCRSLRLPANDHGVLDSYHLDPATKPETFVELLRQLPVGLSEWAAHPSTGDAEAQAIEPETWWIRKADLDFFTAEAAREAIEREGIILLDYHALQPFWST